MSSASATSSSSAIFDSEAEAIYLYDNIDAYNESLSEHDVIGSVEEFLSEHSHYDSDPSDRLGPRSRSPSSWDSEIEIFRNLSSEDPRLPRRLTSAEIDALIPSFATPSDSENETLRDPSSEESLPPRRLTSAESDALTPSFANTPSDLDNETPRSLTPGEIDQELDSADDQSSESDFGSVNGISSRGSSADQLFQNPDLFSRDSYPLSPDLEGELELALLAEMDEHLRNRPYREAAREPNRNGDMAPPRREGGGVNGNEPDVLVDLELHFRQERPQRRAPNQQGPDDVIDLTNEPDSPVQNQPRQSVNLRRQNSQTRNPPSLARSDSSILAGNPPVIDLTDDSPEVPRRPRPENYLGPYPGRRERREPSGFLLRNTASAFSGLAAGLRRHLYPLHFLPGPGAAVEDEVQLLGILQNRIPPEDFNNPLGNIQLQYENGAFDRAESPKPVHQPPPPAKAGYTRDTGSNLVVVCPACNEELAYDPDVPATEVQNARKGKRARSEHHFWALKACGHVYCEDCFENRKPIAKRQNTGLPLDREGKIMCAVDGCDSQATNKGAWVGIFL